VHLFNENMENIVLRNSTEGDSKYRKTTDFFYITIGAVQKPADTFETLKTMDKVQGSSTGSQRPMLYPFFFNVSNLSADTKFQSLHLVLNIRKVSADF